MSDPAGFVADPSSKFLGTFEISREAFDQLPDHPAQRQTPLHAVNLLSFGVLNHPIDQHREVAALLIGDVGTGRTIEAMEAALDNNLMDALQRWGCKLNGHTRAYIWSKNLRPAPETLRLFVYAAADRQAAVQVYNAVDSMASVKARKDVMQSTLNVAGIHPASEFLKKATALAPALDLAAGVLFGSLDYRARHILNVAGDEVRQQADEELHALLPYLAAVRVFKPALVALDTLDIAAKIMPARPPAFIGAYLSILHRDPDKGLSFLQTLKTEPGDYTSGLMDAFYAVRKVFDHLNERQRRARSSPAQRTQQILNCVLNAYEGWWSQADAFKADEFPTRTNAVSRFNPVLKGHADHLQAALAAQRVAAKERRAAEMAERKARRDQAMGIAAAQSPA